jgi:hypothetical protein
MKVSLVRLFIIKSRYLFLYLLYLSLKPVWASGSICRHGDKSLSSPGAIESYSALVLPGFPTIPMMSPLLIVA